MSAVAIVGAGAIARACAALLVRDGHAVALWSPSGGGTRDLAPAPTSIAPWPDAPALSLDAQGLWTGTVAVAALPSTAGIALADVVLVAIPAPAYAAVLPAVAGQLRDAQTVLVSGALSLVPLWLAEMAANRGTYPRVGAFGTTVATARARDGGVSINTIRTRLAVAARPARDVLAVQTTCVGLFGDRFDTAPDVLAVTLTNINPVAHSAMALTNLTRIERAEAWPQYHYLTPAAARLVSAMDAERRAVASAFGLTVTTIEKHFQRSFDVDQSDLADIAAELHRRRGGPPGPTSLDTRFVLEDVPFGLAFNAAVARVAGVPTPVTDAVITTLSTLYDRDLAADNPLLVALDLAGSTPATLRARCSGDMA